MAVLKTQNEHFNTTGTLGLAAERRRFAVNKVKIQGKLGKNALGRFNNVGIQTSIFE